jgi:hypothetical protein
MTTVNVSLERRAFTRAPRLPGAAPSAKTATASGRPTAGGVPIKVPINQILNLDSARHRIPFKPPPSLPQILQHGRELLQGVLKVFNDLFRYLHRRREIG